MLKNFIEEKWNRQKIQITDMLKFSLWNIYFQPIQVWFVCKQT